jgi:hypothetical protein
MPSYFGWKYDPRWHSYHAGSEVVRERVEDNVKALLGKAKKDKAWTNPRGVKHIPLLVDDEIVGQLWQDADLAKLHVGSYWAGPFGQKVELIDGTHVVGMMWVHS